MSEAREAVLKVVAIAVAFGLLGWLARGGLAAHRRKVLMGLAVLGGLGYVNFGRFHTDGSPLHVWDQFHYVLGSKYYPELGYDGMYAAALAARQEVHPTVAPPPRVRDLRTNQVMPALAPGYVTEVRARFTAERWADFRADATRFYLRDDLFVDHGYLPTPARTAVERLFSTHLPFRSRTVALLATIDFLLLALAAFAIHRAFGLEALAAASLVFGLGYCSRYFWVGGAFLRQDWLAALICGAAALRLGRPGLAGAALGYAACARAFPLLALSPLAVFAGAQWWRERRGAAGSWRPRHTLALALGLAGAAAVMLAAGCLAGRGPGAWLEWFRHLGRQTGTIGPNGIGLRVPLSASLANLRGDLVDPESLYLYARVAADYAQQGAARWPLIAAAVAALVALSLRRGWLTADPVTALCAGIGVVYAVTAPAGYYGSFFVLLALVRPLRTARVFLAASALMFLTAAAVFILHLRGLIRLNGAAVYVPVSLLLLVVLVDWLLHADRPENEKRGAVAGAAQGGTTST